MVFWVFGYSSLVWNPGFEYDERIIGFIKNYRRAFHLACIDHRGTPEFPARAATLEAEEGAVCWGAALCVKDDEIAKKVLAYLHVRECEYDVSASIDFFTEESPNMPVLSGILVFITTPDNVNNKYYLGPAPLEDMANQIARASGPCGPNYEYLFKMEAALKQIGHEDEEIIKLADAVRTIMGNLNGDLDANCDTINLCLRIDQNETSINSSKQISFDKNSQSLSKPTLINNFIDSQLNGLNHVSLSNLGHMPHSPKLLKGQAL